ncbi:CPBP family intramembrane metalloprotease [Sporolactobacillus sp. CPB3-1]|uniref:CPBP family intramembrane metalloprotease n=1 Tax=Sporolactobacillus mangiferae TaxID=2940498 RepID=A0ABT0MEV8_9BACL|nr:type II CAAX endopeptidase family protein [Sporolactobacillus mangiferae]MCL1632860.1 CPBP family intramembrane metalloprotease [Sporolactobacillus mangiferae]
MALRYTLIVLVYLACVLSPILPVFPRSAPAYGNTYTAIFISTLLLVALLLIPERRIARGAAASIGESIAWAICGIFILYVLQIASTLINNLIFGQPLASEHTEEIVRLTRGAPFFVLTVSIIGPMLEEIVFRKIFFGSMKRKLGFFFAALFSSLAFAAFHFDFSHLLTYFVIGFFLCYAYHKTGRIWVPMFMHASMNAIVVLASMFLRMPSNVSWIHWLC